MLRDLTMIVSVLVAVVSLGFGVYKNIEASNAKSFAYAQAYRMIQVTNTSGVAAALTALRTPPPVIDFSQSSAAPVQVQAACSDAVQTTCIDLAGQLATQNAQCVQQKGAGVACAQAAQIKSQISAQKCITCFTQ